MKSKRRSRTAHGNLASELICAVNIKYTLDFKDLVWKKKACRVSHE